jgi:hypothetical protein
MKYSDLGMIMLTHINGNPRFEQLACFFILSFPNALIGNPESTIHTSVTFYYESTGANI